MSVVSLPTLCFMLTAFTLQRLDFNLLFWWLKGSTYIYKFEQHQAPPKKTKKKNKQPQSQLSLKPHHLSPSDLPPLPSYITTASLLRLLLSLSFSLLLASLLFSFFPHLLSNTRFDFTLWILLSGVGVAVLGVWVVVMGQGSGAVGFGCLVLFGFLSFAVLVVLPPDFLDFDGYVMYELLGKQLHQLLTNSSLDSTVVDSLLSTAPLSTRQFFFVLSLLSSFLFTALSFSTLRFVQTHVRLFSSFPSTTSPSSPLSSNFSSPLFFFPLFTPLIPVLYPLYPLPLPTDLPFLPPPLLLFLIYSLFPLSHLFLFQPHLQSFLDTSLHLWLALHPPRSSPSPSPAPDAPPSTLPPSSLPAPLPPPPSRPVTLQKILAISLYPCVVSLELLTPPCVFFLLSLGELLLSSLSSFPFLLGDPLLGVVGREFFGEVLRFWLWMGGLVVVLTTVVGLLGELPRYS